MYGKLFLILLVVFFSGAAQAANYALLVGISKYPNLGTGADLEGPAYDIAALQPLLEERFHIKPENMTVLVDKQAGKEAILEAIDRFSHTTRPGDFILLYFSGHGTSANDEDVRWDMSPYTGAFLPADFSLMGNREKMLEQMLIGSRDLQPRLRKLERNRKVLVCIDACYSGYTVRSAVREPGLSYRFFNINHAGAADPIPVATRSSERVPYPYHNTMYLAASSPFEKAIDINSMQLKKGRTTYDGKPHGVFTDALLWGLAGAGDRNRDQILTIGELYSFIRNRVTLGYPQTPQLLKPETVAIDTVLFSTRSQEVTTVPLVAHKISSGQETHPLIAIARKPYMHELRLELDPIGAILLEGQTLGLRVELQHPMHILIVSIGPEGSVELIYPWDGDELQPVTGELRLAEIGKITGPLFGKEYLVAFGFKELPVFLADMVDTLALMDANAGSFPQDDQFVKDIVLAAGNKGVSGASLLPVTTCGENDIVLNEFPDYAK